MEWQYELTGMPIVRSSRLAPWPNAATANLSDLVSTCAHPGRRGGRLHRHRPAGLPALLVRRSVLRRRCPRGAGRRWVRGIGKLGAGHLKLGAGQSALSEPVLHHTAPLQLLSPERPFPRPYSVSSCPTRPLCFRIPAVAKCTPLYSCFVSRFFWFNPARLTRAIVAYVEALVCVDRDRIFAAGYSNGGYFSFRLACEASDLVRPIAARSFPGRPGRSSFGAASIITPLQVRAVGPFAGALSGDNYFPCNNQTKPVPIMVRVIPPRIRRKTPDSPSYRPLPVPSSTRAFTAPTTAWSPTRAARSRSSSTRRTSSAVWTRPSYV